MFKRNVSHPAQLELQSSLGFYNNPSDADGIMRVDSGIFEGMPTLPGYPITAASVQIDTFRTESDVSTGPIGKYQETKETEGDTSLVNTNTKGGGGQYTSSPGSETSYNETVETVTMGDGEIWAEIKFRFPEGASDGTEFFSGLRVM